MAFYFPKYAEHTDYRTRYDNLSAVERGMVLREFVGLTYRHRFQFFKREHFHQPHRAFRNNLHLAASRQDKKFFLKTRIWRKKKQLPAYLELIFRHYVLGFVVQLLRKHHFPQLVAEPGCYPDAPLVAAALEWFVANEARLTILIKHEVEQVMVEDTRHLYLYCLRAFLLTSSLVDDESLSLATQKCNGWRIGGAVPLGAELEFSNLGYRADFNHSFGRHNQDQPYCNFIYFHHFFLEDVSWRLGGYLDHHVRLRRYLPVPWIGGFFEYNLVRIDYPRRFSLPLTRDPGFLARYIQLVMAFNNRVAPHSLHLNVECLAGTGGYAPELADYKCLLLLGGDFARDENGAWIERRLGQNELIKMIRQRNHLSLFDHCHHQVSEFAFLRLSAKRSHEQWCSLLMALVGFNRVTNLGLYCLEALDDLLQWAHNPQPVTAQDIARFMRKVTDGLTVDESLDQAVMHQQIGLLRVWLEQKNQMLSN